MNIFDCIDLCLFVELQVYGCVINVELVEWVSLLLLVCLCWVQWLEVEGVISGYVVQIDLQVVGLGLQVFVWVQLVKYEVVVIECFVVYVGEWEEVVVCYVFIGDMDYFMYVYVVDLEYFLCFLLDCLFNVLGVVDVNFSFVLCIVKCLFLLLLGQLFG